MNNKYKGFTLIELIIVIAVIGILAAAVFVAVDPAKRIGEANNAQRWSDVTAIADAIATYTVDNNGTLPQGVTTTDHTTAKILVMGALRATGTGGSTGSCAATTTSAIAEIGVNLSPTYLPTMPTDPTVATASSTEYYIYYNSTSGRFKVGACNTYNSADISVQR